MPGYGEPCCHEGRPFAGGPGRRIEATLVQFAGVDGALHGVMHLQDDPPGAVLAVLRFVLALDDGEGLHNVVHIVAGNAVEVAIGSVKFATQQKTPRFVPAEGRAVVAAVFGKGGQILGSVGEFKDAEEEPSRESLSRSPGSETRVCRIWKNGHLIHIAISEICSANFLPSYEVKSDCR